MIGLALVAASYSKNLSPWHGLSWALAGVATAALVAVALWLCIVVLPQHLYPPLSNADLAGLSPADQAPRHEGRDKLQNDARTTLLQGLAALLVLGGARIVPKSISGGVSIWAAPVRRRDGGGDRRRRAAGEEA